VSKENPKVQLAGAAAMTLLLGLGTGFILGSQLGAGEGVVDLQVPGALSISVFCGGATTHATGTSVAFVAANVDCEVEAPLSASMPLRGQLWVGQPGAYRCTRDSSHLSCEGPL
jgi:hypothetical protein